MFKNHLRRAASRRLSGYALLVGDACRQPIRLKRADRHLTPTAWYISGVLTLLAGAILGPVPAMAATITSPVTISSNVDSFCILSADDMAFGVYSGTKIDTASTLSVTCTNTTPYQIGADNGLNSIYIGVYAKYMAGPSGNKLRYHLYTDAARSIEWGTTAGATVAGTGTGIVQAIPVYGTIGAGSYVAPGAYSDTATFTINF